ncbi:hypothetical protein ACIOD2_46780 [Amycolatopsis sp. NPDC088138]|uniref:hypothetical protein n=1 Tax=Amycolatopsis sp. NPDC088138 TaxID=3363938 RepID=UPI0037F1BF37
MRKQPEPAVGALSDEVTPVALRDALGPLLADGTLRRGMALTRHANRAAQMPGKRLVDAVLDLATTGRR